MIRQIGNMQVLKEERKKVEYIVFKIGNKIYSTSYSEIKTGKDINIAMEQDVNTIGVGEQKNLWIKGKFTEEQKHSKLSQEVPFEINIYFGEEKS